MRKFFLLLTFVFCLFNMYAQKVGIGTTSPQAQLHTTGTVRFNTLQGNGARLVYVSDSGFLKTALFLVADSVKAIPDASCAGTTSSINVAGIDDPVQSKNIQVKVNITHRFVGDLELYLTSPLGEILKLKGYSTLTNGKNFVNTVFSDNATDDITLAMPPYTGRFKPSNTNSGNVNTFCTDPSYIINFEAFGGGSFNPNGIWTLKIKDRFIADAGTLDNWSISFDNSEPGEQITKLEVAGTINTTAISFNSLNSPLNYYDEDTLALPITNSSGSITYFNDYTVKALRIGNKVTLTFVLDKLNLLIANVGPDIKLSPLPIQFRPSSQQTFPILIRNGGVDGIGLVVIKPSGDIILKPTASSTAGNWNGSLNCGFYAFSVSYIMQ